MLHYAVVFFVIAIIAAILGFGGIAGAAVGIAKILFFVFSSWRCCPCWAAVSAKITATSRHSHRVHDAPNSNQPGALSMEIRKLIAAAALGTGAVFTSMAYAADADNKPKQSVGEYASDATVTTKVKAAFVADKQLSALDIAVETNNGVATLTGTVGTAAEADHAAKVTRGIEGVKQVMNNIKVDPAKNKK